MFGKKSALIGGLLVSAALIFLTPGASHAAGHGGGGHGGGGHGGGGGFHSGGFSSGGFHSGGFRSGGYYGGYRSGYHYGGYYTVADGEPACTINHFGQEATLVSN